MNVTHPKFILYQTQGDLCKKDTSKLAGNTFKQR